MNDYHLKNTNWMLEWIRNLNTFFNIFSLTTYWNKLKLSQVSSYTYILVLIHISWFLCIFLGSYAYILVLMHIYWFLHLYLGSYKVWMHWWTFYHKRRLQHFVVKPKNKSTDSGPRLAWKSVRWHIFIFFIFFFVAIDTCMWLFKSDQISHTHGG